MTLQMQHAVRCDVHAYTCIYIYICMYMYIYIHMSVCMYIMAESTHENSLVITIYTYLAMFIYIRTRPLQYTHAFYIHIYRPCSCYVRVYIYITRERCAGGQVYLRELPRHYHIHIPCDVHIYTYPSTATHIYIIRERCAGGRVYVRELPCRCLAQKPGDSSAGQGHGKNASSH